MGPKNSINFCVCLRTTSEVLNNVWGTPQTNFINYPDFNYSTNTNLSIDDIILWEEIFYIPGAVGIYSAWKPYKDFYILTHNLFLSLETIEKFYDLESLLNRCKDLNIQLQTELVWISN